MFRFRLMCSVRAVSLLRALCRDVRSGNPLCAVYVCLEGCQGRVLALCCLEVCQGQVSVMSWGLRDYLQRNIWAL